MGKTRYHKRNFYLRVEAMQREYRAHADSGRTEMYIYRTFIYPKFYISRATFYNWLAINPRRELARLDGPQGEPPPERGLFDDLPNGSGGKVRNDV